MLKTLALMAVLAIAAPAQAAPARDSVLVTPAWLSAHVADKDLVVLQIGDRAEYEAKHIPGARHVAGDALTVTGPAPTNLTYELPAPEDLRARLQTLGVSDKSHIVVSYSRNSLPAATRVMFTLQAAGLGERAVLLDGGLAAWERSGGVLTAAATPATPGVLSPLKMQAMVVDAAYVKEHLSAPGYAIVDGRATGFYDGAQAGGSTAQPQPKGHVAGAKSVPYSSVQTTDATIKSTEELAAMFKAAGIQSGDTVVAYCHVGQQATVVMLAARLLGIKALLYDGSYQDWAQRGLPVDGPGAGAR